VKTHALVLCAAVGFVACGGKSNPPATPDNPTAPAPTTASSATPASTDTPPTGSKDPAPTAEKYEDPEEVQHGATVTMTPLITKADKAKAKFPKKTVGDKECWQGTALAGEAKKDFEAIIQKCVGPTGLLEYARPVTGKLHHVHDKRDTYKLKLMGGMCYRYFAVADNGITDLDILVTKPGGALVADDKTSHPVAIIEFDKTWCMDDDAEYDFHIEVDGPGTGHYIFGVFTKPK
jgi:hypothetical protein